MKKTATLILAILMIFIMIMTWSPKMIVRREALFNRGRKEEE